MNFTEIAFPDYLATDLTASQAFDDNGLGLTLGAITPHGGDGGWTPLIRIHAKLTGGGER